MHVRVTREPLDPAAVLRRVGAPEDGAALLFLGIVRNHADGRPVSGMEYDAYEEMAQAVLADIAQEAAERLGTDRVAVEHRWGPMAVGEVSVAVAVSSPHRAEAYDASRYVIEEIKRRLPVWKREHYTDGDADWVSGETPPGTGRRGAAHAVSDPSSTGQAEGGAS